MLELIRKHQDGIMVLVAVIVIFAFAWWGDFFGRGENVPGRGQPFISLGGKTYTRSQISKIAAGSQVAQRHFPFYHFQIERAYRRYDLPGLDFALNTLALRKHAVDYGVAVSPGEIDKRMLDMPEFQTPEARARIYQMYGSLGLGEGDVAQIVGDVITLEKLSGLVSAGLIASEGGAEYDYASRYQTIFASVATIPDVKPEEVEVTEEELREAFEARKGSLLTERQVSIRYVFFEAPDESPRQVTVPLPTPKLPDPEKSEGEAGATGGDKEKDAGEKAPDTQPGTGSEGAEGEEGKPGEGGAAEDTGTEKNAENPGGKNTDTPVKPKPGEENSGGGSETVEPKGDEKKPEGAKGIQNQAGQKPAEGTKPKTGGDEKPAQGEAKPPKAEPESGKDEKKPEAPDVVKPEKPEVTPAEPKELSFEERAKMRKEFNALVDQFWGEFYKDGEFVPGVDFAEVAKDDRYDLKVVETGAFSRSKPPEEIADQIELVAAAIGKSLDPPISDPIKATGDKKGYFIFEILKVEEPREKTFEEAKKEIEEGLRRDKGAEATVVATDEARERVLKAVEGGKPFVAAATEAGLEVVELKPFSPSEPPAEPMNLREMMAVLMSVVPGEVSEPVNLSEGKALVFVTKRELWKRADAETLFAGVKSGAVSSQGFDLLGEWFSRVRNAWDERVL